VVVGGALADVPGTDGAAERVSPGLYH
jgi:hypothetical protein